MFHPTTDIIVLDFGGQYSQLITRRIREMGVYCELMPHNTSLDQIQARHPRGLILSGGPASAYGPDAPTCDLGILDLHIPILGVCYGMQYLAHHLGGRVDKGVHREYGPVELKIEDHTDLFQDLPPSQICWMSHGDLVLAPSEGFTITARTANSPVAAMANLQQRIYAVQFHPEVAHTEHGQAMLRNFVRGICGCEPTWTMDTFIQETITEIREQVGGAHLVCGLSGGIDSAAAAALVYRAVGDQLTCIFVDNGLMRKNEVEEVVRTFRQEFQIPLIHVPAGQRFLSKLKGVTDPERKRKIIGEEFIRVFEEEARKIGDVRYLVQGTLYSDIIESGTATAATIKSHHNVGGLPEHMELDLVEPLRDLFKDEVRQLASQLGLPDELVWRQPFPGPGLGVRIMGEVTEEKIHLLQEADAIVVEEIAKAGLGREIWQYFAVLANTRTVGVQGDERTYGYLVGIRAVTSEDAMTADWARIPYPVLEKISGRIMNEISGINRVVYDISSKPPATIEWE